MTDELQESYDAVVVGGGAAGLAGALTLARARRSVVVVDAGSPRNAPADGVHGLLGLEGVAPGELVRRGRTEVRGYGGHVVDGEVVALERADGPDTTAFTVGLADGRRVRARRLLVTTGLVDELPDVPGLRERWGRDVVHCPYCHGWEVRDRRIAVLGSSPVSGHQATLFRQWTDDLTYVTHAAGAPSPELAEQLAARGTRVVEAEVTEVVVEHDRITGLRLVDGTVVACDVVAVGSRLVARTGLLTALGLSAVPHPTGVGEHVAVDAMGRTDVPGVWAAGNVADLTAQVGAAAAAGTFAAAQLNMDLVLEDTRLALAASRVGAA